MMPFRTMMLTLASSTPCGCLRSLQAIAKVKKTVLRDFLFPHDYAPNAVPEPEMQASMDKFFRACGNFGLTINIQKTEVMHYTQNSKSQPKGRNYR